MHLYQLLIFSIFRYSSKRIETLLFNRVNALYNTDMRKKAFSLIKFFVGWPFSILAVVFLIRFTTPKLSSLSDVFLHVQPTFIFFAIVSFSLYYFLRSFIWRSILQEQNIALPYRETNWLWALSELQRYIPGSIWSFVSRTVLFTKNNDKRKEIAAALVIESELIVLGALLIALLAIPFFLPSLLPVSVIGSITVYGITLLITLGYVYQQKIFQKLLKHLSWPFLQQLLSTLSPNTQIRLLGASAISFFFFGLGYYFAISSFVFLHPKDLFSFIGLFSFALLTGYLSFITPTGLGVREAIITGGLTIAGIPISIAGIAAVLGRVVLIISELVFLSVAYILHRVRIAVFDRFLRYCVQHPYEILLLVAVLLYILYFSAASFLRYDNFYTGRFDLGNMSQTVWNTTQGRLFTLTNPNGTESVSRLAFHADFILVLFAPLYSIWPHPKTLLLLQTVILASGAFFAYGIAHIVLKRKLLAFLFGLSYLLSPAIQFANLYDFHAVVLATTFLIGAFYYLLKKRYVLFLLFAVLAGITKEQVWTVVALFGLYTVFFQKKIRFGMLLFAASVGIFIFLVWQAIPTVLGSQHFAVSFYSDFGDSPSSLIKNMVFSPAKTIQTLTEADRVAYLKQLFLPMGYLSLLSPFFLIFAAPDLLINLLSSNKNMQQIYYQYTATITPFFLISAVYGVKLLLTKLKQIPETVIAGFLCSMCLYAAFLYGPLPGAKHSNLAMFVNQVPDRDSIHALIKKLPRNSKIAATNNLGAQLSNRKDIYTIPLGIAEADYVAFLLNDSFVQPSLIVQKMLAMELRYNENYVLLYEKGDFLVFKKR